MKNRDLFLKKLSNMDDAELADVMCNILDCYECPGSTCCADNGMTALTGWMGKEAKDEWTDFS